MILSFHFPEILPSALSKLALRTCSEDRGKELYEFGARSRIAAA